MPDLIFPDCPCCGSSSSSSAESSQVSSQASSFSESSQVSSQASSFSEASLSVSQASSQASVSAASQASSSAFSGSVGSQSQSASVECGTWLVLPDFDFCGLGDCQLDCVDQCNWEACCQASSSSSSSSSSSIGPCCPGLPSRLYAIITPVSCNCLVGPVSFPMDYTNSLPSDGFLNGVPGWISPDDYFIGCGIYHMQTFIFCDNNVWTAGFMCAGHNAGMVSGSAECDPFDFVGTGPTTNTACCSDSLADFTIEVTE